MLCGAQSGVVQVVDMTGDEVEKWEWCHRDRGREGEEGGEGDVGGSGGQGSGRRW